MRRTKNPYIVAVIPAYNEEDRIEKVIKSIEKYVNLIVVVDDGSTDKTVDKIKSKKVLILRHEINLGQGASLQTGFDYAKRLQPDVVITYDADGQFEPSDIPKVIRPILKGKYDIVLGSRFLGKTINLPLSKHFVLKSGVLFTRIFSGVNVTDTHNGFRALNQNALKKIHIIHNRMAHASEIIDQTKEYKLKYKEVPVTVKYLTKVNQSSLNAFTILFDLISKKLF